MLQPTLPTPMRRRRTWIASRSPVCSVRLGIRKAGTPNYLLFALGKMVKTDQRGISVLVIMGIALTKGEKPDV